MWSWPASSAAVIAWPPGSSVPKESIVCTTATCPWPAALANGVLPRGLGSMPALAASNSAAMSLLPSEQAK